MKLGKIIYLLFVQLMPGSLPGLSGRGQMLAKIFAMLTLQPHPVAHTHGAVVVKVTFALSTIF